MSNPATDSYSDEKEPVDSSGSWGRYSGPEHYDDDGITGDTTSPIHRT